MTTHHRLWPVAGLAAPMAFAACALASGGAPLLTEPDLHASSAVTLEGNGGHMFRRIATFPVFENTSIDIATSAEIITVTGDGNTLIYSDAVSGNIGFIDITDPANPVADGAVAVGDATSVTVFGDYALVAVNTSESFVKTSGHIDVIDIATRMSVRQIDLGGQPDCIAVSPSGLYAAVAIENERDEDLGSGDPPQLPAGFFVIVDLVGGVADWATRTVELTGITDLFPEDPEPEFVDINSKDLAAITLQENNHVILVDLKTGTVAGDFSCGTVDLQDVDAIEDDIINQVDMLRAVPREPDALTWIGDDRLATADEGDLYGGSRGFTIFDPSGTVVFSSASSVEHITARVGHYPESRSENKGAEPEGTEYGVYGKGEDAQPCLFIGCERASVVLVYRMNGDDEPVLQQVLPATIGPEGLLAIPERNLFVATGEEDSRDDGFRAGVSIFELGEHANYPAIVSDDRGDDGVPIPWAALSGLAGAPDSGMLYTIHDSYYRQSRVYGLQLEGDDDPARIVSETVITDDGGVLLTALNALKDELPGADAFDPASIVNDDLTVNLDPEGVAIGASLVWVASEGAGNLVDGVSDPDDRPFETPDLIVGVNDTGVIEEVVLLPIDLTRNQLRFGFEGVAAVQEDGGEVLYVCFQRPWTAAGDPGGEMARIGRYEVATGDWTFAYYPLDAVESPQGGWVGLSEITALGEGYFLVLERDNQANYDARVKRVYQFSVAGVEFKPNADQATFDTIAKSRTRDAMLSGALTAGGGFVTEKLEGMTVLGDRSIIVVNDNDGVDDNSGETQIYELGRCNGDANFDGKVDVADLLLVLAAWGSDSFLGDLNFSGGVDVSDLLVVLSEWGATCE